MEYAPEFERFTPYKPMFLVRFRKHEALCERVRKMTESEWAAYVQAHEDRARDEQEGENA